MKVVPAQERMMTDTGQEISPPVPLSEDLYARLGASRHMTQAQLKRQYWRTARRFHPDLHQAAGEDQAHEYGEIFKRIAEAWDILGDAEKRKIYDETGQYPTAQAPRSSPQTAPRQTYYNQQMWKAFEAFFVQGGRQPAAFGKIFQLQQLQRLAAFLHDSGCQALFRKIMHGHLPMDLDPDVRFMAASFAAQVPYAPVLHQSVLELALQFRLQDEHVTELIKRVIHTTLRNVRATRECLPGLEHHLVRALTDGQTLTGAQRAAIIRAVGSLAQQSPRIRLLLWQEMDRQGLGEASHIAAVTALLDVPQPQRHDIQQFLQLLRTRTSLTPCTKIAIIHGLQRHTGLPEVVEALTGIAAGYSDSIDMQLEAVEALQEHAVDNGAIRQGLKTIIARHPGTPVGARAIRLLGRFMLRHQEDADFVYRLATQPYQVNDMQRRAALEALGAVVHEPKACMCLQTITVNRYEKLTYRLVALAQLERLMPHTAMQTFLITCFNDPYADEAIHLALLEIFTRHRYIPAVWEVVCQTARFHRKPAIQKHALRAISS